MYYSIVFYPAVSPVVEEIRRKHDPTARVVEPHVAMLIPPVPDSIREGQLVTHIESVVRDYARFEVRLGGFHKSPDHWLFVILQEGNRNVMELCDALYTGILAEFRRTDIEFVPHLGLGIFWRDGVPYDWEDPPESALDAVRYEKALAEAKVAGVDSQSLVETLHLVKIPDEVLQWQPGNGPLSDELQVTEVREFRLQKRGA